MIALIIKTTELDVTMGTTYIESNITAITANCQT